MGDKTGFKPVYPARHTVNQLLRKTRAVVRMIDPEVADSIKIDGNLGKRFLFAVQLIDRTAYSLPFTLYVTAVLGLGGVGIADLHLESGITLSHMNRLNQLSKEAAKEPPEPDEDKAEAEVVTTTSASPTTQLGQAVCHNELGFPCPKGCTGCDKT